MNSFRMPLQSWWHPPYIFQDSSWSTDHSLKRNGLENLKQWKSPALRMHFLVFVLWSQHRFVNYTHLDTVPYTCHFLHVRIVDDFTWRGDRIDLAPGHSTPVYSIRGIDLFILPDNFMVDNFISGHRRLHWPAFYCYCLICLHSDAERLKRTKRTMFTRTALNRRNQ